jgi:CheY-like chemotaxis protein
MEEQDKTKEKSAVSQLTASQPIETIMVIDDDQDWCFVIKMILQKAGFGKQVITAYNGLDGLKKLQAIAASGEKLPELIFLDLRMPVMDGFEFLNEITNSSELNLHQTKIFIVTSSNLSQDKEKATGYTIAGFISKPLTPETLSEILN